MTLLSSVIIFHCLATVSVVVISFQSKGASQGKVFWVAPSLDQCGNKTPCDTLEGFQRNSTVFSTSHSTWIFMKGEHFMARSDIVISGATNITWTGEKDCVSGRAECILYIAAEWPGGLSTYIHIYMIMINNAEFVSIKDIKVTHEREQLLTRYGSTDRQSMNNTCVLQVRNVRTFRITSISYIFSTNLFLHGKCIEIHQPSGSYDIVNSTIQINLFSIQAKKLGRWGTIMDNERRILSLNIMNSHFLYGTFVINVGGSDNVDYHYVDIAITESQFIGLSGSPISVPHMFKRQLSEINITISQDNVALNIERNLFIGSSSTVVGLQLPVFLFQNKAQGTIIIKQSNVSVMLYRSWFIQLKRFDVDFQLHCPHNCNITTCSECTVTHPMVTIQRSFLACIGGFQAVLPRLPECFTEIMMLKYHPVTIAITTSVFQNFDYRYQVSAYTLSFHGFNWLRASLKGGNTIILRSYFPEAHGLFLEESDFQIYGSNKVDHYKRNVKCTDKLCKERSQVAILLSSNSHLLLSNNSQLQIFKPSPLRRYESVNFPITLIRITNHINETFEDFVICGVLKPATCPGLCFFQFIDEYGRYVKEEELGSMRALLYTPLRYVLIKKGYNTTSLASIVNGHFNRCRLNTLSGTTEVSNNILNRTFSYDVRKDATVPYEICLCQPIMPNNKTLWNCNQTSSLSVYHGQKVQLLVTLLGDFRKIINTYPEVVVTNVDEEDSKLSTRVRVCTSVYSQSIGKPNETHVLRLQTTHETFREYTLNHYVKVHILPCPPGMIDVGLKCSCNALS